MDIGDYFGMLEERFGEVYEVASRAKSKGLDPKPIVEVKVAPDIAGRVEGLIGVKGLAAMLNRLQGDKSRTELAFDTVKEICTGSYFESYDSIKRIELAVKVGLAILTEGVVVAPTEGIQYISHLKNPDNSDYIAIYYAGPIRGAGGTSAALSLAFADYARRFFNIGAYKAEPSEIERYVEEIEIYHERVTPLPYRPSPEEIRTIVSNCPICLEGVPTEEVEASVHINLVRKGFDNSDIAVSNRIRSGVALVLSNMALKARSVSKAVKKAGLEWNWLDSIITISKAKKGAEDTGSVKAAFLEKLVAGRPILAYPGHFGGFRLRYGRSRLTGIAAKGFSPATMAIVNDFIGLGTQVMVELPGKACVAAPVDTIEGPFVKLKSGKTMRINDTATALRLRGDVSNILSLGDILITYGDFKKTNTPLQPSSYVEEVWEAQVRAAGLEGRIDHGSISFGKAYDISLAYGVPMHPRFLYEFQGVKQDELKQLAAAVGAALERAKSIGDIHDLELAAGTGAGISRTLELLMVPAEVKEGKIAIEADYARSLAASLGFVRGKEASVSTEGVLEKYDAAYDDTIVLANAVAPFKVMRRSTFIGARIGRPEKAGERLMTPAPHVLFPVGFQGVKDRNLTGQYTPSRFGRQGGGTVVEIARYRCKSCGARLDTPYCYKCKKSTSLEYLCQKCGLAQSSPACSRCGGETSAYEQREVDFHKLVADAVARLGYAKTPRMVKGVKGLTNRNRIAEPIEKGILRSMFNVMVFKDGTARFDATDTPMTHFYPSEIGVSVEKLRELGYTTDYEGNELRSGEQLVELRHQDIILNRRGADYLVSISKFVDEMLQRLYGMPPFYNMTAGQDMVGQLVLTLAPHTSCAVLNRVIGFTDANVGFAHPYVISARRRNADGDEDTVMLLLDVLINFSREFLPTSIGGTMDEPLLLVTRVVPQEVDDEVHAMEVVDRFGLDFYNKTFAGSAPSDAKVEIVEDRLKGGDPYNKLCFTHLSGANAIRESPKKSEYTLLKTMDEKIDEEFRIMDMLESIDKRDAAKRLINSHFIRDLMGNLHSYSKQQFRCVSCGAHYRRVPLSGKCTRCGGKLLLTISKGSIEKYMNTATKLAERYGLDTYTKQRLRLIKSEIDNVFGSYEINAEENRGQFNLVNFM